MSDTPVPASPDEQPPTREEKDSLGVFRVPADALYGVQTARAVHNFPISGLRAWPELIGAIVTVKKAAADGIGEPTAAALTDLKEGLRVVVLQGQITGSKVTAKELVIAPKKKKKAQL